MKKRDREGQEAQRKNKRYVKLSCTREEGGLFLSVPQGQRIVVQTCTTSVPLPLNKRTWNREANASQFPSIEESKDSSIELSPHSKEELTPGFRDLNKSVNLKGTKTKVLYSFSNGPTSPEDIHYPSLVRPLTVLRQNVGEKEVGEHPSQQEEPSKEEESTQDNHQEHSPTDHTPSHRTATRSPSIEREDHPLDQENRGRNNLQAHREYTPTPVNELAAPPPTYNIYWQVKEDATTLSVPAFVKWLQSSTKTRNSPMIRWALTSLDNELGALKLPIKSNQELAALVEFDICNYARNPYGIISYLHIDKESRDICALAKGHQPNYCTPIGISPVPSDLSYSKLVSTLNGIGKNKLWSEYTNFRKIPNSAAAQIQVWFPWKRNLIFRHPEMSNPIARIFPILPPPGKKDDTAIILYNTRGAPTTTDMIIKIIKELSPPNNAIPKAVIQFVNPTDSTEEQKWLLGFDYQIEAQAFLTNKEWLTTIPPELFLNLSMGPCKGPPANSNQTPEKKKQGQKRGRGRGKGR